MVGWTVSTVSRSTVGMMIQHHHSKPVNNLALRYYMDHFDFAGLRLDVAFRRLCSKLYLKAETQQVDRILEEFSRRYWELNLNTVFGSASESAYPGS